MWLTQAQLAELYDTSVPNIAQIIRRVLDEGEATEGTINSELKVRTEGARTVRREIKIYNLLSEILRTFNDQFGNIAWTDADRVQRLITEDIPRRVAADEAYQNAQRNSDPQNARIEHDRALGRVMMALLKDDTELFKQFSDNESFKRWLSDTVFRSTYGASA